MIVGRELSFVEPLVDASLLEQFGVRSLFGDPPLVDDDDSIGALDGGEAVGNHDSGAAYNEFIDGFLDGLLAFRIEARCSLVENQDGRGP